MQDVKTLKLSYEEAGIFTWNLDSDVVFCDSAVSFLYGFEKSEGLAGIKLRDMLNRIHPEDRPRIAMSISETIEMAESFFAEFRILRPDGEIITVQTSGRCFRVDNGPTYHAGIIYPLYQIEKKQGDDIHHLLTSLRVAAIKLGNVEVLDHLKQIHDLLEN